MTSQTTEQSFALQLNYEAISGMAETIAKQTGIRSIQNFEPLLLGMGGRVERITPQEWSSPDAPILVVNGAKNFTAYLGIENQALDRLLLACALGHYIMHSQEGRRPHKFMRFAKDAQSIEALWFGMSIIISDEAFAVTEACEDIDDQTIANLFQTTPDLIRLKRKLRMSARKAQKCAA